MMTIDKLEKQVSQILEQAKGLKKQAMRFQKVGQTMTRQNKIKAREFLHKIFDSGLTLLSRRLNTGRKVKESFETVKSKPRHSKNRINKSKKQGSHLTNTSRSH